MSQSADPRAANRLVKKRPLPELPKAPKDLYDSSDDESEYMSGGFFSWLGCCCSPRKTKPAEVRSRLGTPSIDWNIPVMPVIKINSRSIAEEKAADIVSNIMEIYSKLVALPQLHPCETTNALFTRLVKECSQIHDAETRSEVLSNHRLQRILPTLQRLCADGETALERWWADHIAQAPNAEEARKRLASFPYYANYEDLTRMELCAIQSVEPRILQRIAFIGSGPLPLSPLCLTRALEREVFQGGLGGGGGGSTTPLAAKRTSFPTIRHVLTPEICNIDRDARAIEMSTRLCQRLGFSDREMAFRCEAADDPAARELAAFDLVYIAALVGDTQQAKEDLILAVADRMQPGALLLIRSAWGLRTFLYPNFDVTTNGRLLGRLEVLVVVHPFGAVVNSVIVARVRPKE